MAGEILRWMRRFCWGTILVARVFMAGGYILFSLEIGFYIPGARGTPVGLKILTGR